MKKTEFTSKEISIELHKLYWCKPSKYYYEWTGATEIEELNYPCWLIDNINVYTANQMAREFPEKTAINENVKEFGLLPDDNIATKRAKVLVYLIKNGIYKNRFSPV